MTPTTNRATPSKRPKILCIDDDPGISDALSLRLERYGIDVIPAYQGMQGFWTALDAQPDAVICDLVMPGGEGNHIVSRLRSHALTKDVPVFVLTGYKNAAVKRQMLSVGVSAYFTKPLVLDELLRNCELFGRLNSAPAGSLMGVVEPWTLRFIHGFRQSRQQGSCLIGFGEKEASPRIECGLLIDQARRNHDNGDLLGVGAVP